MSYRDFATSEIDILRANINNRLEYMDKNPDEFDADTMGTEYEHGLKMLYILDAVYRTINNQLPSDITRKDGVYFADLLKDIFNGIPLSELHSYEEAPDEWIKWENCEVNTRYSNFVRRTLKIVDVEGKEIEKIFYTDYTRYSLFDLITNKSINIGDTGVAAQLINMFDQLYPITFPYNVKDDKLRFYIELFDVTLQDNAKPVKTLTITCCKAINSGAVDRIYRFFDITSGVMKEIDVKAYTTRRQIFEKQADDSNNE